MGISLALSALLTTSCIGGESSPLISIEFVALNDSIVLEQPPVQVGDTLYVGMVLTGYEFPLDYLQINVDREYFSDAMCGDPKELSSIFTDFSAPQKGSYLFQKDIKTVAATWALVPTKAPKDYKEPFAVELYLKSHAKADEKFNPYYRKFWVLITDPTQQPSAK